MFNLVLFFIFLIAIEANLILPNIPLVFSLNQLSAYNPCIAIEGAYLLCQAVEVMEDGVIGI